MEKGGWDPLTVYPWSVPSVIDGTAASSPGTNAGLATGRTRISTSRSWRSYAFAANGGDQPLLGHHSDQARSLEV